MLCKILFLLLNRSFRTHGKISHARVRSSRKNPRDSLREMCKTRTWHYVTTQPIKENFCGDNPYCADDHLK